MVVGKADEEGAEEPVGLLVAVGYADAVGTLVSVGLVVGKQLGTVVIVTVGLAVGIQVIVGAADGPTGRSVGSAVDDGCAVGFVG